MTIVVRDDVIGTFNWEVPEKVKNLFDEMRSGGEKIGFWGAEIDEALQRVIEYFQDSIRPLLCLLCGSVFSGPLFDHQALVIQEGIGRMLLECRASSDTGNSDKLDSR